MAVVPQNIIDQYNEYCSIEPLNPEYDTFYDKQIQDIFDLARISKPQLLSRGWLKMFEFLDFFDLFPSDDYRYTCFFNCDFPGGFMSATHHWLHSKGKIMNWTISSLLKDGEDSLHKDENSFVDSYPYQTLVGPVAIAGRTVWCDGDVTDKAMQQILPALNNSRQGKVDLYTADGETDLRAPDRQEDTHFDIIEGEWEIAKRVLKDGGSCIIKFFGALNPQTQDLIRIMEDSFRESYMVKPIASSAFSCEMYFVGLGYNQDPVVREALKALSGLYASQIIAVQSKSSLNLEILRKMKILVNEKFGIDMMTTLTNLRDYYPILVPAHRLQFTGEHSFTSEVGRYRRELMGTKLKPIQYFDQIRFRIDEDVRYPKVYTSRILRKACELKRMIGDTEDAIVVIDDTFDGRDLYKLMALYPTIKWIYFTPMTIQPNPNVVHLVYRSNRKMSDIITTVDPKGNLIKYPISRSIVTNQPSITPENMITIIDETPFSVIGIQKDIRPSDLSVIRNACISLGRDCFFVSWKMSSDNVSLFKNLLFSSDIVRSDIFSKYIIHSSLPDLDTLDTIERISDQYANDEIMQALTEDKIKYPDGNIQLALFTHTSQRDITIMYDGERKNNSLSMKYILELEAKLKYYNAVYRVGVFALRNEWPIMSNDVAVAEELFDDYDIRYLKT